jgi:MFS family permease
MTIATLTVHLIPSLRDQGLTLQSASFVWAATLGVSWVSQLLGGYFGDKVDKAVAMAVLSWVMAAGLCLAAFTGNPLMALTFAVVYGVGFGARIPLGTSIRGEYFGRKAFGTILGLSAVPMSAFMMAGPLFAGAMFDARGSYSLAFIVLAGVAAMGGFLLLLAKKPTLPAQAEAVVAPAS